MGIDPTVSKHEIGTPTQLLQGFSVLILNSVLNVKVLVATFIQENALVGAFSVIVKSSGTFG